VENSVQGDRKTGKQEDPQTDRTSVELCIGRSPANSWQRLSKSYEQNICNCSINATSPGCSKTFRKAWACQKDCKVYTPNKTKKGASGK